MKKKDLLSAREEELMNRLWEFGEALTSMEMAKRLEPEGWNHATLLKTVQSLSDAGYLAVSGLEKSVKTYARKLEPSITKEEYYVTVLKKRGINSDSLAELTAALIGVSKEKKKEKDAKVIARLEEIIDELRSESFEDE